MEGHRTSEAAGGTGEDHGVFQHPASGAQGEPAPGDASHATTSSQRQPRELRGDKVHDAGPQFPMEPVSGMEPPEVASAGGATGLRPELELVGQPEPGTAGGADTTAAAAGAAAAAAAPGDNTCTSAVAPAPAPAPPSPPRPSADGAAAIAPAPAPSAVAPSPASAPDPAAAAGAPNRIINAASSISSSAAAAANDTAASATATAATGRDPAQPKLPPQPTALPPQFVAPSSYLRPRSINRSAMASAPEPMPQPKPRQQQPPPPSQSQHSAHDKDEIQGLRNIRDFLKVRCGYDVFPLSFRLIVLDNDLLIKKSLNILIQNAIVSAPLWDSRSSTFAGILTATDYMNVIQYYCQFPHEMVKLDQFRLRSLRDIEKSIGAIPIETVSVNPSLPLFDAVTRMLSTRARRIPLVDVDDETGREWVVSVITQYRILKFIAVNNEHNTVLLKKTVRELNLGTYSNLATTTMGSTVLEAIQLMVERNISCVPVVDENNRVLNIFESVDIIPCIRGGVYEELNDTVGDALCKRPEDSPGVYTCSEEDRLQAIFDTIRKSRVHRLVVVDDDNKLRGVISLSDILMYVLLTEEA